MNRRYEAQKGSVLALFAVCLTMLMVSIALSVDIGWIMVSRAQLQSAADAAALASASELVDEDILLGSPNQTDDVVFARDAAEEYAFLNEAVHRNLYVDRNDANLDNGGVVIGYVDNPLDWQSPFDSVSASGYNTARVQAVLNTQFNGPLGLFLGTFTGVRELNVGAQSAATIDDRVVGFDLPPDSLFPCLPFTVYFHAWDEAVDGGTHLAGNTCPHEPDEDNYEYNETTETVNHSSDGIAEVKMYPYNNSVCTSPGAPGNFGTIDIGPDNNSTSDIHDQIVNGINTDDFQAIGGLLLTDDDGDGVFTKWLNGDTGVSSEVKAPLEEIIGKPRLLPLYRTLIGNGDTAVYEIVRFVPVRVMNVIMTGKMENRCVIIQPCQLTMDNAIIHPDAPHTGYIHVLSLTQ